MFWGSDQGTNFTIASKEMKGIISDIDEHKVNKFCLQRDKRTAGQRRSVMAEAVYIINSRPVFG